MRRVGDIACVFRIQLASMRAETGPFLLAAVLFPAAMYFFTNAIAGLQNTSNQNQLRFLAGSIVFSLSLSSISWLGYLLLENRFTGRLKLYATLPLTPSSYIFGILLFALAQAAVATTTLILLGRILGLYFKPKLMLVALVIGLTVLCLCGLGAIVAARARSFTQGSLITDALGTGLVFLAPVYYPVDTMPQSLKMFSQLLPTTFAARALQTTLTGGSQIGGDLLALALLATVTLFLGLRLTTWREE